MKYGSVFKFCYAALINPFSRKMQKFNRTQMTQIVKIFTDKIVLYHNYQRHLRSIIDFIDRH